MKNISTLTCDLDVSFKTATVTFSARDSLSVEASSTGRLEIRAKPDEVKSYRNQLCISIRDNPKVEVINISCAGVGVRFEMEPRAIDFGRAVVDKVERKTCVFRNHSNVAVSWTFADAKEALRYYGVSKLKGTIEPNCTDAVVFEFVADKIMDVPLTKMQVHVRRKNLVHDHV